MLIARSFVCLCCWFLLLNIHRNTYQKIKHQLLIGICICFSWITSKGKVHWFNVFGPDFLYPWKILVSFMFVTLVLSDPGPLNPSILKIWQTCLIVLLTVSPCNISLLIFPKLFLLSVCLESYIKQSILLPYHVCFSQLGGSWLYEASLKH